MGEEDNGIHEILATGVNKPPAPFNKHQQERRPHGKPGPAPSDAVKLTIKHKLKMARSRCRPPAKGEYQEARFTDPWYLTGVREPHGAHSSPRDAHLNLWLTAEIDSHSRTTHSISTGLLPFRRPSLSSVQALYSYPGFNSRSRTTPIERKEMHGPLRFREIERMYNRRCPTPSPCLSAAQEAQS